MWLSHCQQLPDAQLWTSPNGEQTIIFSTSPRQQTIQELPSHRVPTKLATTALAGRYLHLRVRLRRRLNATNTAVWSLINLALLVGVVLHPYLTTHTRIWGSTAVATVILLGIELTLVLSNTLLIQTLRPIRRFYTPIHPESRLADLLALIDWPTKISDPTARHRFHCALWWTPPTAKYTASMDIFDDPGSAHVYLPEQNPEENEYFAKIRPNLSQSDIELGLNLWDPKASGALSSLQTALAMAHLATSPLMD